MVGIVVVVCLGCFLLGPNPSCAEEAKKVWTVEGTESQFTLDEATLQVTVDRAGTTWRMRPAGKDDLVITADGKRTRLSFLDAETIAVEAYETGFSRGVKVSLDGFAAKGKRFDLSLALLVSVDVAKDELVFRIVPSEKTSKIDRCNWPKGIEPGEADFTVVPFMQGMLLPRDWPRRVRLYNQLSWGRGLYMPWWGQLKGKAGFMAIIETPWDGGINFSHREGGPTDISPMWVHSLGSLSYARTLRYIFFDDCNHVTLAKRYRRYAIETGRFVSLNEKIARTPILKNVIGSPVVHTSILYHTEPDSSYYDKDDPEKNHRLRTFEQRAADLKALHEKGVHRAYVHLDGWGLRGYDNLHPDVIPPCPEAGGWDGMKMFSEVCEQLGYTFVIHDQYRDYYLDAASYDERHTLIGKNGKRPYGSTWLGGKQSILCATLAPGYVKRNHDAIFDHGVKLKGAYLDVFAVVVPDECYNPEHPMTRRDCLRYRGECFDYVRSRGGIVSSEEPTDWAVPHIDLVHHGPYALDPNPGKGPAMGIPVPLFSLVYHDALILPWSMGKGAWGIHEADLGMLHALLNAGIPYIGLDPGQDEMDRVRQVCDLHEWAGLLEMTNHEFLDSSYRKQRSTFADGTQVEIDLDKDSFKINYGESASAETQQPR